MGNRKHICSQCKEPFISGRRDTRFCCGYCRNKFYRSIPKVAAKRALERASDAYRTSQKEYLKGYNKRKDAETERLRCKVKSKRNRDEISDRYVIDKIKQHLGISRPGQALIDLYRLQIATHREVRRRKNQLKNI